MPKEMQIAPEPQKTFPVAASDRSQEDHVQIISSMTHYYLNTKAHKCGPNTNNPIITPSIALNKTAPAATSLATLASAWYSGEARSTHISITVLNISAIKTLVIATKIIANSTAEMRSSSPIRIARKAIATCTLA